MKDKVQKIREEVVRMHNLLPIMDGDNISVNYADRICTTLEMYIDSMQEESIHRTQADIDAAMAEVEEKSKAFTEAHKGETAEEILAQMRGEEPVSEELEEAAEKYAHEAYSHPVDRNIEKADFIAGAKWQKQQMMAKAVDSEVGYWNQRGLSVLMNLPSEFEEGDKCKIMLIKED